MYRPDPVGGPGYKGCRESEWGRPYIISWRVLRRCRIDGWNIPHFPASDLTGLLIDGPPETCYFSVTFAYFRPIMCALLHENAPVLAPRISISRITQPLTPQHYSPIFIPPRIGFVSYAGLLPVMERCGNVAQQVFTSHRILNGCWSVATSPPTLARPGFGSNGLYISRHEV